MNVIETRGLGRRYGSFWALRECDLAVPEGHLVALVGPNGAGKTTLLNIAVGLTSPTVGAVSVLGVSLSARRRRWTGSGSWGRTCRCTGTCPSRTCCT